MSDQIDLIVGKDRPNKPKGLPQSYHLIEKIGQGQFSKVYLCNDQDRRYAVKQISLLGKQNKYTQMNKKQMDILSKINHNNIVKFYQSFQENNHLYIVLEYCQTDLFDYTHRNNICQKDALEILRQILQGYRQLRKKNICHRDIKLQNILIKQTPMKVTVKSKISQKGKVKIVENQTLVIQRTIKLADFGFSKMMQKNGNGLMKTYIGTPFYMAPEIKQKEAIYSNKCDIWSLGLMLYQMILGTPQWQNYSIDQRLFIMFKNSQFDNSKLISKQTNLLIRMMLTKDEKNRIGWQELTNQVNNIISGNFQGFLLKNSKFLKIKPSQPLHLWNANKNIIKQASKNEKFVFQLLNSSKEKKQNKEGIKTKQNSKEICNKQINKGNEKRLQNKKNTAVCVNKNMNLRSNNFPKKVLNKKNPPSSKHPYLKAGGKSSRTQPSKKQIKKQTNEKREPKTAN